MEATRLALNPLTLAEMLRPWRNAGVFYLLPTGNSAGGDCQECEEHSVLEQATPSQPLGHAQTQAKVSSEMPTFSAEVASSIVANNAQQVAKQAGLSSVITSASSSAAPATSRPASVASKLSSANTSQPNAWPEAWQAAYAKAQASFKAHALTPQILWNYADLVYDLYLQGDKQRSDLLRSLIKHLDLPRGSSVFWPSSILDSNLQKQVDSQIFYSGIAALNPKAILLLGASALEEAQLPLNLGHSYTNQIYQGRMYILLPEWQALLQASQFQMACTFLRTTAQQILFAAPKAD